MKCRSKAKSFGGFVEYYEHDSETTKTPMRFSVYLPPQAAKGKVPVLYWLSGLTCTEENFTVKSGVQKYASRLGVAIIAPDTSPRGAGIPGEGDHWDFGLGAGYYVNATQAPWSKNYRMYDYVLQELRLLVEKSFPVESKKTGIFGHSMGGHGALVLGLRNPDVYKTVSAFAPITNPSQVQWGIKAFGTFLGPDKELWKTYDACELLQKTTRRDAILVDQGTADDRKDISLFPDRLEAVAQKIGYPLQLRYQEGYDHGYFFISSFIEDHLNFHSEKLNLIK